MDALRAERIKCEMILSTRTSVCSLSSRVILTCTSLQVLYQRIQITSDEFHIQMFCRIPRSRLIQLLRTREKPAAEINNLKKRRGDVERRDGVHHV